MVEMVMGEEDVAERKAFVADELLELSLLVGKVAAGVDDGALSCDVVPNDVGVLFERVENETLDFHLYRRNVMCRC